MVIVSKNVKPHIIKGGKKYTLVAMRYLNFDIKKLKEFYTKRRIKFLTVQYRHPDDNLDATLFYVNILK